MTEQPNNTPSEIKTVLITGASSGYGKATAERYAQQGNCRLILIARRLERLEALKTQLEPQTAGIYIQSVDLTKPEDIDGFFGTLPQAFRSIDILVNSGGLALGVEPAQAAVLENWNTMIQTNITGLVHMTRRCLDLMTPQRSGHIVNIGSVAGQWPYPGGNVYGSTKAFVKMFSQSLKTDLLGTGIRVTNLEPGLSQTEFSDVRLKDSEKAASVYEGTQPLKGEDIAEIITWVTALPKHVNINALEVMPTCQAWSNFQIDRTTS